jgi:Txe/YoeB family toxin of Txe-Axe toxin-antitoxin module
LKHAKPKQKNTKTCTNKIKELMKQLNVDFKNISKHPKKIDTKKRQEESKKICDAKTIVVHVECRSKHHVDVM